MGTYKIVFKGQVKEGHNKEKLKAPLCKFLKISLEKADILFSGKAFLLKKGLSEEAAKKLHASLEKIGLVSHLIYEETVTEGITTQHEETELPTRVRQQTLSNCPHCGEDLYKPVAQNVKQSETSLDVEVKPSWRRIFDLFDRMGGPSANLTQMKKSEAYQQFSFGETLKVNFSIWGFLFGPFYYFYLGMWSKAFLLLIASNIGLSILNLMADFIKPLIYNVSTALLIPVVFAQLAKFDYYRFKVLRESTYNQLPEFFHNKLAITLLFLLSAALLIATDPDFEDILKNEISVESSSSIPLAEDKGIFCDSKYVVTGVSNLISNKIMTRLNSNYAADVKLNNIRQQSKNDFEMYCSAFAEISYFGDGGAARVNYVVTKQDNSSDYYIEVTGI